MSIAHIDLIKARCLGCVVSQQYEYEIIFQTGNIKLISKRRLPRPKDVMGGSITVRYRFLINKKLEAIPSITFLQTHMNSGKQEKLHFEYRNDRFEILNG